MNPAGLMRLFVSLAYFKRVFRAGLSAILENELVTASQVVLVINNAIAIEDQELFDAAMVKAGQMLENLQGAAGNADHATMRLVQRHVQSGKDPFAMIRSRTTKSGIKLLCNLSRLFRERHAADNKAATIHVPFSLGAFNFTRVPAECFVVEVWQGTRISFFYNKSPYGEGWNFLAVPDVGKHLDQIITPKYLALMMALGDQARRIFPDLVVGYNSMGAYASIPQLHFHLISTGSGRPGSGAPGTSYTLVEPAWEAVHSVQQADQAFNLIYSHHLRVVPRLFQGTEGEAGRPAWNTGFAFWELDGAVIVTDPGIFWLLRDQDIWNVYDRLCPDHVRLPLAA